MAQDGRPDATKLRTKGVQGAPAAEHIRMAPFLFEKSLLIPPSASNHVRCASGASCLQAPGDVAQVGQEEGNECSTWIVAVIALPVCEGDRPMRTLDKSEPPRYPGRESTFSGGDEHKAVTS